MLHPCLMILELMANVDIRYGKLLYLLQTSGARHCSESLSGNAIWGKGPPYGGSLLPKR